MIKINNKLSILENKQLSITSVELVEIINQFRILGDGNTELLHKNFMDKIRKEIAVLEKLNLEGVLNFKLSYYINSQNKKQPCYELTRDGMLQMLNSESALVRYKTIEYINKLESRISEQLSTDKEQFEKELLATEFTAKFLNLNEASKIKMLQGVYENNKIPTNTLPIYIEGTIIKSATTLLKQFNIDVSSLAFNKLLLTNGFLEEKERPSKSKGIKKYKSITQKGLNYGENQKSPNNIMETQPLWYEDKFQELLNIILN